MPGTGEDGDLFGTSLSVGDTNGETYVDVLVGASGKSVGSASAAGQATLLRRSAAGLTGTGARGYSQNTSGVPGAAEAGLDHRGQKALPTSLRRPGREATGARAPPRSFQTAA